MKKIILVDGNNLLFRSYYETSYSGVIMRNSKGFPTNALYGFINMMNKINEITDDINTKLKSLNGFFSVIDFTTDKLATITDKFTEAVTSLIRRVFKRKKEEEYEEDE